jgi:hypothetical protein
MTETPSPEQTAAEQQKPCRCCGKSFPENQLHEDSGLCPCCLVDAIRNISG